MKKVLLIFSLLCTFFSISYTAVADSDDDFVYNILTKNCQEADLEKRNFEGMNLEGYNFEKAKLDRTNFKKANLKNANFKGADIENAMANVEVTR